jgi:hypothetical protein
MDALRGKPVGFITPRIYQVGAEEPEGTSVDGLGEITSGSTCVGTAAPGWNTATGWGSPRALQLFEHLAGSYVNVSLAASPSPVAPGGSVSIEVRVVNESSGRPIAGLPVGVTLDGSYSGPCSTFSASNATTGPTGSANTTVGVSACYLGNSVTVSVDVESGGYYGSNSTTLAVNLLGLAGFLALAQTFPYNVIAFAVIMLAAVAVGLVLGGRRRRARAGAGPAGPDAVGSMGPSAAAAGASESSAAAPAWTAAPYIPAPPPTPPERAPEPGPPPPSPPSVGELPPPAPGPDGSAPNGVGP